MMSTIVIPTSQTESDYTQVVTLEGVDYQLFFHWNARQPGWYCEIRDTDGTLIAAAKKLVLGTFIFEHDKDERMPPGAFLLIDTTESGREPGLRDLGTRVVFIYVEAAEEGEAVAVAA
jgi:hypothetical protein